MGFIIRKAILYGIILCILNTIYILCEIVILENHLLLKKGVIRYAAAIMTGFLFELHLAGLTLFRIENRVYRFIKTKEKALITYIKWLLFSLLLGIYLGLGFGTLLMVASKCIFCLSLTQTLQVKYGYALSLLWGGVAGIFIFFSVIMAILIKKPNCRRNTSKSP